mmetsp:Transcript_25182/g.33422  ORF Transcript_25182/g.33422 Transcript_25182/m.33422 type:complete len:302 (-) Transcript_25182:144-1049(-)|eukprot:15333027-Ditylum_brightwellii.AAC.1
MLGSTLSRSLVATRSLRPYQQVRQFSALEPGRSSQGEQRRNVHSTPQSKKSAVESVLPKIETVEEKDESRDLTKRFKITGEVIVSKIFPAGFGWQSASIIADSHLGFASDSMAFALTTGFGDAVGVLMGHCGFYAIKKAVTGNEKILMRREFDTGVLLASAAFCSGSLWQPLVDTLQGANLSFSSVFAGTWVGCGTAFYLGLRAGRTVLPGMLKYVEEPTYENSTTDAALSVAIGGATGFFVGTDAVYLPEQNFLIDVVGITESTPELMGCAIAGTSTSLGFGVAQTGLNVAYPAGKCWND